MSTVFTRYDTSDTDERELGLSAAVTAIRKGRLVVLPTDTVYGLAADAFDAESVRRLLSAKGRGREMPPPVLVSATTTLDALAVGVPEWARVLVEHYWPGPLTIVVAQQSSLQWDLGDTRGTVAIRMPNDPVALELLTRTGPLAVSSANKSGRPPATNVASAIDMLSEDVEVFLDGGSTTDDQASTIIDCTGDNARVLRVGAIPVEEIRALLGEHDVALETM
jgi:tRNA threonylcarbamoyl adenosine modification protein (Sua5/YciO/YrdC/YwlC family)